MFDVDRLGQNQVGADAESLGYSRLPFNNGDRQRCLVIGRVAGTFEQKRGVLLIITVHDNRIEALAH